MKHRLVMAVLTALFALSVFACGGGQPEPAPGQTPPAATEPTETT